MITQAVLPTERLNSPRATEIGSDLPPNKTSISLSETDTTTPVDPLKMPLSALAMKQINRPSLSVKQSLVMDQLLPAAKKRMGRL